MGDSGTNRNYGMLDALMWCPRDDTVDVKCTPCPANTPGMDNSAIGREATQTHEGEKEASRGANEGQEVEPVIINTDMLLMSQTEGGTAISQVVGIEKRKRGRPKGKKSTATTKSAKKKQAKKTKIGEGVAGKGKVARRKENSMEREIREAEEGTACEASPNRGEDKGAQEGCDGSRGKGNDATTATGSGKKKGTEGSGGSKTRAGGSGRTKKETRRGGKNLKKKVDEDQKMDDDEEGNDDM